MPEKIEETLVTLGLFIGGVWVALQLWGRKQDVDIILTSLPTDKIEYIKRETKKITQKAKETGYKNLGDPDTVVKVIEQSAVDAVNAGRDAVETIDKTVQDLAKAIDIGKVWDSLEEARLRRRY